MWIYLATRVKAGLSVKMLAANLLLTILFLPGAVTGCGLHSDLFITTPKNMKALSGSCLQIPCNFSASQEHDFGLGKIFGVWIKNNPYFGENPKNVVFNSSGTVLTYPMNITGNLSQKQCATLFSNMSSIHTDKYFFRIHSSSLRATDICNALQIRVIDSPPSPVINVLGNLKEKESLTVTCSAFTPCPNSPPKLIWNLLKDSNNNLEGNTDGTFTAQIQEIITLTDKHDGYNITCSATYPLNGGKDNKTAEETRTLSVLYSPKNTTASMSPLGLVSADATVNLTCSSRAKPPVRNFTWFKISTGGPLKVFEGDFYSFNVAEGGVYYCEATNDVGNEASSKVKVTMRDRGFASTSFKWGAILGGIFGIIVIICLVILVWRLKSEGQTPPEPQSQAGEHASVKTPAEKTKGEEKEGEGEDPIHYGEIVFLEQRPKPSSDSAQDAGHQQDTLYSEVKVRNTTNNQTQAADGVEDLYMNVRNTVDAVVEATHDT
ncbi:sialic acid-binding Ig-like lectin 12 [Xyrichtys novacula]|uniref:Sialic acid-binding Ig-like lectin 12 n=1 Tax=Xyrichtys novacula TaxID=13765 RepID=A0AAV1H915_XYRNO|nr:sialic acid-binding Ig-like lectin 12 [Xyrichtys novacula]